MPALRQHEYLRLRHLLLDSLPLPRRPVFVIFSLNDQNRALDQTEVFLDIPRPESRIKPDLVPSPKRLVGMGVVAPQLASEVRGLVCGLGASDAFERQFFHADVRRLEYQE